MKRVLIVDDKINMGSFLRKMMETCGFEIAGEALGESAAIELYKELRPDIVTMDVTISGAAGVEAIKKLKILDNDARIIAMSSIKQNGIAGDAITAGAVAFIIEPSLNII